MLGEFDSTACSEILKLGGEKLTCMASVNAVAPGSVDTEQFKKECRENPEQFWLDCQAT